MRGLFFFFLSFLFSFLFSVLRHMVDGDDVELNVLGCRFDILGTNCDQCVCMVQCCLSSIRLIRTGSPGRPPPLSHSSRTMTAIWPVTRRLLWRVDVNARRWSSG